MATCWYRDERIVEIAAEIATAEVSRGIDAIGLVLLPGVIDPTIVWAVGEEMDRNLEIGK